MLLLYNMPLRSDSMTTLDDVLKELYQNIKNFVKAKNIESEREYFSNPKIGRASCRERVLLIV